jgi:PKD repeat protein
MKYLPLYFLTILLFMASLVSAQGPHVNPEWAKLYGDSLDQRPHKVKAFGDGVYVAGEMDWNGTVYGTFSKFNPTTGSLIWHFRMNISSSFSDFEWDPVQDLFVVVGGTQPFSSSVDNKSLAVLVDDTGIAQRVREFDFIGREGFTTIVRHQMPPDPAFPFYVLGGKNPSTNTPSSFDEPILLNLNLSLMEKWEHEFMGPFVNGTAIEIEGVRGLVPLSSGEILILGNGSVANEGVVIVVDGLTGFPTNSLYYPDFIDFYDGVELPNGEIALVGERFQSHEAIVLIIEPANYQSVAGMVFSDVRQFREVGLGNPGTNGGEYPLFMVGDLKNNPQAFNYMHKVDYAPGSGISLEYSRHLPVTATNFADPHLSVTQLRNRIFYADSRVEPSAPTPSRDMFIGNFSLDFDPECVEDATSPYLGYAANPTVFNIRFRTKINGPDQLAIPVTLPLPFTCSSYCVPEFCSADFSFETDCCKGIFTSNVTGTAPFTYDWDIGCDGVADGIGNVPNFNYTFPGSGTYLVCLTVTDATGCQTTRVQKTVAVVDDPPVFNCVNVVIPTDLGECYATYTPIIEVTDDCTPMLQPICRFSGAITGRAPIDSFPKGITTVDCVVEDIKGQLATCQFTITVEDREAPIIFCSAPISVTVPGCEGGARVPWNDPFFADNCPMATITSTHQSEDFFSCGTTTVIYTVTDMAGLMTSCSFPVVVNCACAEVVAPEMTCTDIDNQYAFSFLVNDLTGATPSNCTATVTTVQSGINLSSVTFRNGVISGLIDIPAAPIPTIIRLDVRVTCICPDGTSLTCTIPVFLTTPCCKEISIDDQEQCRSNGNVVINLLGCNNLFDVRQVRYYVSDAPCFPGSPMTLIQVSQDCRPLTLAPQYHNGDVCVYAEVDMGPGAGPCRQLRTDTALVKLCSPVSGTLANQTFCYAATPVTPNLITLNLSNPDACDYTIQWFDNTNTPIPGATGLTYQPPAMSMTPGSIACSESIGYVAEIMSICGVRRPKAIIQLDNNDAPIGEIILQTPDTNPLCYGEDAVLEYVRNCQEPDDRWTWEQRTASTPFADITTNGNQNPLYLTNRLYEDHWYRITEQNGVCPVDTVDYFLDIIDPLTITSFTAAHGPVCAPTQIDMTLNWTPAQPGCTYKVIWYHDGNAVKVETVTTGPLSYSYVPPVGTPLAGNFYAEVASNCCGTLVKTPVVTLDPPMEVLVAGPCFRCKDEFIKLTGIVLNAPAGVTCTYQWYTAGFPIPGANSIDLHVDPGFYGPITFEVTCTDGCVRTVDYNINQCGPGARPIPVATNEITLLRNEAYPNPTSGTVFIELEAPVAFERLEVLSITGQLVKTINGSRYGTRHEANLSGLPAGTYLIRGLTQDGELLVVKSIKE